MNPLIRVANPHEQEHPWDNDRVRGEAIARVSRKTDHMDIDDEDLADLIGCESESGAHTLLDSIRGKHQLKMQRWAAANHPLMVAEAELIVREERDEAAMYEAEAREAA